MDHQRFVSNLFCLSEVIAPRIESLPPTFKTQLSELAQELGNYSLEQCYQILSVLDDITENIAIRWKKEHKSNFIIFPLKKLRATVVKHIKHIERPIDVQILDKKRILATMLSSSKRIERQFPDSARAFVDLARTSDVFSLSMPADVEWPSSLPVLFSLNAATLDLQTLKHISINTGHCLLGAEPQEDHWRVVEGASEYGMTAQDVFLYEHVKLFSDFLTERNILNFVTVNLDTHYYRDKLVARFDGSLNQGAAMKLITSISFKHRETIGAILPNSKIVESHEEARLEQLREVIQGGLLEFVASQYTELGEARIEGIAQVAASYLYMPLVQNIYTLFIESALDVQVPVQIVLPYLRRKGKLNNFCFIGLLPLPDLKMSHGAMYFGHAEKGKLYIGLPDDFVAERIQRMSINWVKPCNCFYTHYYLAKNNSIPTSVCHPSLCQDHVRMVIEDFQDTQLKYRK